jgi:hypothetical protein
MIDLDAIRARNEKQKRHTALAFKAKPEDMIWENVAPQTADIDALLAEVERLTAPNPLASPVWPDPEESGP